MKTSEQAGKLIRLKDYQTRASAADIQRTAIPGIRLTLKAAREAAKMTETEAAAALQIKPATLHSWESGKTSPSMDKAIKLSAVYNLSLDNLVFSKAENQTKSL